MSSKKKKLSPKSSGVSGGGWEVTYTGFVLIMLCFFIMLCSFSSVESSKVTSFAKSFSLAVSIFTGGLNFTKGDVLLPASSDMVDAQSELSNVYEELKNILKQSGITEDGVGKSVETFGIQGGLGIRFSDTVLFELGQADINPAAWPLLHKIGLVLQKSAHLIRIDGHTDDLPINTVMFPSNWELSTTRAINVLRHFIEKENISANRLSAQGFGEYQPLAANTTDGGRGKNRRVEILIFKPGEMTKKKEIVN